MEKPTVLRFPTRRTRPAQWADRTLILGCIAFILLLMLALFATAIAQTGAILNCSGTIGSTAAAIAFAQPPTSYVMIVNPSAAAKLWIDAKGGTAAANASGSLPLESEGSSVTLSPTPTVSIIASADATPYTCLYR